LNRKFGWEKNHKTADETYLHSTHATTVIPYINVNNIHKDDTTNRNISLGIVPKVYG